MGETYCTFTANPIYNVISHCNGLFVSCLRDELLGLSFRWMLTQNSPFSATNGHIGVPRDHVSHCTELKIHLKLEIRIRGLWIRWKFRLKLAVVRKKHLWREMAHEWCTYTQLEYPSDLRWRVEAFCAKISCAHKNYVLHLK